MRPKPTPSHMHTHMPMRLAEASCCSPYVCHAELNAVLNKNAASLQGAVRDAANSFLFVAVLC